MSTPKEKIIQVLLRYSVDDTKRGDGRKFGPVVGAAKPFEVVAEELIDRGASVHESMGADGGVVENRDDVAGLDGRFGVLQDGQVSLVVAEQKLHVEANGETARKDVLNLFDLGRDGDCLGGCVACGELQPLLSVKGLEHLNRKFIVLPLRTRTQKKAPSSKTAEWRSRRGQS